MNNLRCVIALAALCLLCPPVAAQSAPEASLIFTMTLHEPGIAFEQMRSDCRNWCGDRTWSNLWALPAADANNAAEGRFHCMGNVPRNPSVNVLGSVMRSSDTQQTNNLMQRANTNRDELVKAVATYESVFNGPSPFANAPLPPTEEGKPTVARLRIDVYHAAKAMQDAQAQYDKTVQELSEAQGEACQRTFSHQNIRDVALEVVPLPSEKQRLYVCKCTAPVQ